MVTVEASRESTNAKLFARIPPRTSNALLVLGSKTFIPTEPPKNTALIVTEFEELYMPYKELSLSPK